MNNPFLAAALVALLLAMWALDHQRAELAAANSSLHALESDASRNLTLIEQQQGALADMTALHEEVATINRRTRAIQAELSAQDERRAQQLKELARNDPDVAAYLARPVPVAVGLRHARTETTDPRAWREPGTVQASPVSPARAAGLP